MATSVSEISEWFDEGVRRGATHLVVVCDTFSWEDFPKYVMPGKDAREEADSLGKEGMNKVMEVYDLALDKDAQLAERRAFNF